MAICFLTAVLCTACNSDDPSPDVSALMTDVKIHRFDQELFSLDSNDFDQSAMRLRSDYPSFSKVYMDIMQVDKLKKALPSNTILPLIKSKHMQSLSDTCNLIFEDLGPEEDLLSEAFGYWKHYFPNYPVPKTVSFISEYSVGCFTYGDSILGLGLDFFLGENYPKYPYDYFPKHIRKYMQRQYMVPKAMEALILNYMGNSPGNQMIDHLIHNGKKLYILKKLMPESPDSILFNFSPVELDWCKDNEFNIWSYFIHEKLLHSTDKMKIVKYIDYSPHSPGMPEDAPGRTGNYIGYKIIEQYMQRNKRSKLSDLLKNQDSQLILNKSRYKPKPK